MPKPCKKITENRNQQDQNIVSSGDDDTDQNKDYRRTDKMHDFAVSVQVLWQIKRIKLGEAFEIQGLHLSSLGVTTWYLS